MNYSDIRKKFVELSGRYDLVDSVWNDNGADFFLNAGQMLLDDMITAPKSTARYLEKVTAGSYLVKTAGIKSVHEVWVTKHSDLSRYQLTKATLSELRSEYGEEISVIQQGDPVYYAPVALRPYPDTLSGTSPTVLDFADLVLSDSHYTYNGILLLPPCSEAMTVAIVGAFYSPALSASFNGSTWTQTKSWWTEVHPLAVLYAGLYTLETFYRNTEGANDWLKSLQLRLTGIDFNTAEQEASEINQMEG